MPDARLATKANFPSRVIEMPEGARVLSAQAQEGKPFVWALVDTEKPPRPAAFKLFGTGHDVGSLEGYAFVDTIQLLGGQFILHLFVEAVCTT